MQTGGCMNFPVYCKRKIMIISTFEWFTKWIIIFMQFWRTLKDEDAKEKEAQIRNAKEYEIML